MNKLIVSNIISLDNGIYNLNFINKSSIVNILGDVTIYIIDSKIEDLIINLEDNSNLTIYKYDKLLNNDINIVINQNNNSSVFYNGSYINEKDVILKIDNYIKGNNNNSNISIRNISNNNYSNMVINVEVLSNTINNIALEDLKGINNGGLIKIEPNIKCASNEVSANHLTTIGIVDKDSINYLTSKGISEDNARNILLKGFIYSNMDEYIKNLGGE